jgi:cobalamin biosynthesis Co2+ chelatase CbiK
LRAIEASRGQKGLILISFGTVISMKDIPKTTFEYFLQVFEKYHDYEFLWKFDSEEELLLKLLQKFDNVHVKKWLNIFEILGKK